ncbi:uncharacterized protein MONOS_12376 [Monocercomonoides exilis]|uniref:uncharacterized protein n=1 Tax=Monocercomonoides exilis TaxID=2049356 RepID=UPI00355A2CAC|nr:hypothetical protein MONOS_12376 [Monocercomonoides exilis]|eukprot:MONOS_12376.1-p1 / transcript=MONOS_12376.1 / gene=MONOS_12376 / organism=Monocercomonoides_exilis_PA203 / gene_product=unspecified product / transcript_product=unspecified product / location=Mono_scaffold00681:6639-8423(-) / protein_length=550 / sequence_SO=supercontig / SO=protein_coding / is_pseudo=false
MNQETSFSMVEDRDDEVISFQKQVKAATTIQRWFRNQYSREIFTRLKDSIRRIEEASTNDILRLLSPKDAMLLSDSSMEARVRFRFGGTVFPPFIYFKVFVETPRSYLIDGRTTTEKSEKFIEESSKMMGLGQFSQVLWESNSADSKQQAHSIPCDSQPAFVGGRSNQWRLVSVPEPITLIGASPSYLCEPDVDPVVLGDISETGDVKVKASYSRTLGMGDARSIKIVPSLPGIVSNRKQKISKFQSVNDKSKDMFDPNEYKYIPPQKHTLSIPIFHSTSKNPHHSSEEKLNPSLSRSPHSSKERIISPSKRSAEALFTALAQIHDGNHNAAAQRITWGFTREECKDAAKRIKAHTFHKDAEKAARLNRERDQELNDEELEGFENSNVGRRKRKKIASRIEFMQEMREQIEEEVLHTSITTLEQVKQLSRFTPESRKNAISPHPINSKQLNGTFSPSVNTADIGKDADVGFSDDMDSQTITPPVSEDDSSSIKLEELLTKNSSSMVGNQFRNVKTRKSFSESDDELMAEADEVMKWVDGIGDELSDTLT